MAGKGRATDIDRTRIVRMNEMGEWQRFFPPEMAQTFTFILQRQQNFHPVICVCEAYCVRSIMRAKTIIMMGCLDKPFA